MLKYSTHNDSKFELTFQSLSGLSKTSSDYRKLINYTNPIEAGPSACGDLSVAVFEVVEKRFNATQHHSKSINIGEINALLDELSAMKTASSDTQEHNNNRQKQKQRVRWVTKLIAKKLSVSSYERTNDLCQPSISLTKNF